MEALTSKLTALMAFLAVSGCYLHAQDTTNYTHNKPTIRISVHKQVDKNGNLISYDSVYSYSYHSNSPDTAFARSMYNNFERPSMGLGSSFYNNMPDFMNNPFLQGFNPTMSMEDIQKMMNKEMQQFMKNADMPDTQYLPIYPKTAPYIPNNRHKTVLRHTEKTYSKHNIVSGSTQI